MPADMGNAPFGGEGGATLNGNNSLKKELLTFRCQKRDKLTWNPYGYCLLVKMLIYCTYPPGSLIHFRQRAHHG
jgi:hypothetical protein